MCYESLTSGMNVVNGEVYSIPHYVIKDCQWLATGQWFSPGTPVTDRHDISEILLKVALNTINQPTIFDESTN
jgi:hypothetical protein